MNAGYIVPISRPTNISPTPISLATDWILHLDTIHDRKARRLTDLLEALNHYELITVPLPSPWGRSPPSLAMGELRGFFSQTGRCQGGGGWVAGAEGGS